MHENKWKICWEIGDKTKESTLQGINSDDCYRGKAFVGLNRRYYQEQKQSPLAVWKMLFELESLCFCSRDWPVQAPTTASSTLKNLWIKLFEWCFMRSLEQNIWQSFNFFLDISLLVWKCWRPTHARRPRRRRKNTAKDKVSFTFLNAYSL